MQNLTVPKKLLIRIPHWRDMLCSKQQNVFTATPTAHTFPGVTVAPAAWMMLSPQAIEFAALFPMRMNDMP
jgi:hypothetical protein